MVDIERLQDVSCGLSFFGKTTTNRAGVHPPFLLLVLIFPFFFQTVFLPTNYLLELYTCCQCFKRYSKMIRRLLDDYSYIYVRSSNNLRIIFE